MAGGAGEAGGSGEGDGSEGRGPAREVSPEPPKPAFEVRGDPASEEPAEVTSPQCTGEAPVLRDVRLESPGDPAAQAVAVDAVNDTARRLETEFRVEFDPPIGIAPGDFLPTLPRPGRVAGPCDAGANPGDGAGPFELQVRIELPPARANDSSSSTSWVPAPFTT